jgi:hypothetical protein
VSLLCIVASVDLRKKQLKITRLARAAEARNPIDESAMRHRRLAWPPGHRCLVLLVAVRVVVAFTAALPH